jgi:Domain of unknown function (DUF4157)
LPEQKIISAQPQVVSNTAGQVMPAQEPLKQDNDKEALQGIFIQRKLTIGAVDDPLEQEADAMADKVMRMPEQPFVQRKCARCDEEEKVQRSPLAASITPFIQAKGGDGGTASDTVTQRINATRGSGSSMDMPTQSFMESRFGTDFSNVKIHTGDYAVQMSRELNAQAFTVGSDIYFNSGKYNPLSESGKHLLAHELTHTVQQGQGITRRVQRISCRLPRAHMLLEIDRCRRDLDVTDEASIARALVCLGVRENMLGNLSTIFNDVAGRTPEHTRVGRMMTVSERTAAFELLMTIIPGGGFYGNCNRIISAWNAPKDDLGPADTIERGKYPTILHYMRELTFLGSGGTSTDDAGAYPAAIRSFPMITLAGATSGSMHVHPRNVYFVASAQVRMDVLSGMDETVPLPGSATERMRIHYVAPGGVSRQVRMLAHKLRPLRRAGTRRRPVPAANLNIYNNILGQVQMLQAVMQQQTNEEAATTTGDEAAHAEETIRAWFTANESFFNALVPVSDVAALPAAATALRAVLTTVPRGTGQQNHGFGAVDPHGTDHALGFAIDLFNGTSVVQNFGLERAYLPFVNFVADNFTHTYESDGERHEIDFTGGTRITSTQQLPPNMARDLSILLQEKGEEAYLQIIGQRAVIEAAVRDRPAERRDAATIGSVRRLLRRFMPQIRILLDRSHREFRADETFRNMAESLLDSVRYQIRMADSFSPQQLNDLLAEDLDKLDELVTQALQLIPPTGGDGTREQITVVNTELATLTGRRLNAAERRRRNELVRQLRTLNREAGRLDVIIGQLERLDTISDTGLPPVDLEQANTILTDAIEDDGMQARFEARRLAVLLDIVDNRAFRNWLIRVRERGIYTQPPLMVNAINEVRSFPGQEDMAPGEEYRHTHFQGGHHWQVAPRAIIVDNDAYIAALRRDMSQRSPADLQRIIRTINEWDEARGILTSDRFLITALGRSIPHEEGETDNTAGQRLIRDALAP